VYGKLQVLNSPQSATIRGDVPARTAASDETSSRRVRSVRVELRTTLVRRTDRLASNSDETADRCGHDTTECLLDAATADVFVFAGERCDRVVARVLAKLAVGLP
jgi:hypothetical protein